MTASVSPAVHISLPRLLPAALFAVATMLGGSTFGDPAVANAAPRESGTSGHTTNVCKTD